MQGSSRPKVAIKTLGCKLNQFESRQIGEQFARLGCEAVGFKDQADIYIINSCTVTSRTDRDCRRLIRRAKKRNPKAFVVVTGCYVEVNPEALAAIPEADLVADNAAKGDIGRRVRAELDGVMRWPPASESREGSGYSLGGEMLDGFAEHTRAFVKVQEGCDARCAYCIIPFARGPSRSAPADEVRAQVQRLAAAGHAEIVLIGTHLGKYGEDIPGSPGLADLVASLTGAPGLGRLRLSSIEPREVTERIIELVAGDAAVCRHLHVPMQSGCDAVLRRMGRPYDTAAYAELIERIHQIEPRVCLGADVIVGFPGETEEEFEATREFIRRLPLSYLHVFTYSARPGTRAAEMPGQVGYEIKIRRNHELRESSEGKRAGFANLMVGEVLDAVLERPARDRPGTLDGLTDNYLRIHAAGVDELIGAIRSVRVLRSEAGVLCGRIEGVAHTDAIRSA